MLRYQIYILALWLSLTSAGAVSAATTLFGVSGNKAASPGDLFEVDDNSGQLTFLTDVLSTGLSGLAIDSTGTLFATSASKLSPSVLYRLDPDTTGAFNATLIGTVVGDSGAVSIGDLAMQPGTGVLYGIRSNTDGAAMGGEIYTINTATGAASLIGMSEPANVGGGLAFSSDGALWRTGHCDSIAGSCPVVVHELRKIDPDSATTVEVTMTNLSVHYDGLAFREVDGVLFATGNDGSIRILHPIAKIESMLIPGPEHRLSDLAFGPGPVVTRVITWGRLKQLYRSKE